MRAKEDTPLLVHSLSSRHLKYNFADKDALKDSSGDYKTFKFWFLNLGLLSCYVVCGLIIAALSASVENIASNVGRRSTSIATVYVARGVGSVVASVASSPIFTHFNAITSLIVTYIVTDVVMLWLPHIDTMLNLHMAYFLIGGLTSLISAGSILLIRKIHKEHAGPWLGSLGAALVSAGIIVPGVQMSFDRLTDQFFVYACIIFLGGLWLWLLPFIPEDVHRNLKVPSSSVVVIAQESGDFDVFDDMEENTAFFMTPVACASAVSSSSLFTLLSETQHQDNEKMLGPHHDNNSLGTAIDSSGLDTAVAASKLLTKTLPQTDYRSARLETSQTMSPPHYWADLLISLMVFFIIGGGTTFSIYIETYVDDTAVIASREKAVLLLVFFCAGTFANISGIFVQISIGDKRLGHTTSCALAVGAIGTILIMMLPSSGSALWVGVACFGFASSITVGFCFNIANRLSYPSATSTSIIMIGSSVGVSVIPYITSILIKRFQDPHMIILVGVVSMVAPILLLEMAPRLSYIDHDF